MRKIFAIGMLVVYLFNLAGYSFLFTYCIERADKKIEQIADNSSYSATDLIELKFKLNLPYITDWSEYERYDGQVEFNGEHYNYVKRKVSQDTLYLLCLPNKLKTKLNKDRTDYAVKANDTPGGNEKGNTLLKKNIQSSEFCPTFSLYNFSIGELNTSQQFPCVTTQTENTFIELTGQPPEPISA